MCYWVINNVVLHTFASDFCHVFICKSQKILYLIKFNQT